MPEFVTSVKQKRSLILHYCLLLGRITSIMVLLSQTVYGLLNFLEQYCLTILELKCTPILWGITNV